MTPPRCPSCPTGRLTRNGWRHVDVPRVEGRSLRWERSVVARLLCKTCGKSRGPGDDTAEARVEAAKALVHDVLARDGMEAAVAASGLTDRTVERWADHVSDARLESDLPAGIVIAPAGRHALISDAGTGDLLDASLAGVDDIADILSRRGRDVEVAWIWPAALLRESVGRGLGSAEVRIPPAVAGERLLGLLSAFDVPDGPPVARLLAERVAGSGWDGPAIRMLHGLCRSGHPVGDVFLSLWKDEVLAGLPHPGPAMPARVDPALSLTRLRARISRVTRAPAMASDPSG